MHCSRWRSSGARGPGPNGNAQRSEARGDETVAIESLPGSALTAGAFFAA
jgi:hypothetical protein